jgi:hypothetical protein
MSSIAIPFINILLGLIKLQKIVKNALITVLNISVRIGEGGEVKLGPCYIFGQDTSAPLEY